MIRHGPTSRWGRDFLNLCGLAHSSLKPREAIRAARFNDIESMPRDPGMDLRWRQHAMRATALPISRRVVEEWLNIPWNDLDRQVSLPC